MGEQNEKILKDAGELKEKAKSEVISDVKRSPVDAVDTAPKMVTEAKKKVDNNTKAEVATKDVAKEKLDKAQDEFSDTVKALEARTALLAHLATIDPKDFFHAVDEIEKVKAESKPVEAFFGEGDTVLDDIDAKDIAIQDSAREFYHSLSSGVTELAEIPDINRDEVQSLMHLIVQMEQAKSHNFIGVTEREAKKLHKEFSAQSDWARKVIRENVSVLTKDGADSFQRLESALVAQEEAEQGSPKDKEKAKERMDTVVAEQDARRIWQALPYNPDVNESWRSTDITKDVGPGWNKNGANYQNYMAALNSFQLGVKMAEGKDSDSNAKAVQLFRVAAEKWKLVQSGYEEAQVEKKKANEGKELERSSAKKRLAEVRGIVDKLSKTTAKALLTDEIAKFQGLSEKIGGKLDPDYDYNKAVTELDGIELSFSRVEKKYDDLKSTLNSKFEAACKHASGIGEKTEANVLHVVSDYMNDVYDHLDEDSKKMIGGIGLVRTLNLGIDQGFIPLGVFDTQNFKGEIWVTYSSDGHAKVEAGSYRQPIEKTLIEDLTETPESLEKRKEMIAYYLEKSVDSAIAEAQKKDSNPGNYIYTLKDKLLPEVVKEAYRIGDGSNYQKNYEAACGLVVVKFITTESAVYKITVGRGKSGDVIITTKKFEAEKDSH